MIPKIIHNIWIQGYTELPEKNKANQIKIKKLNPDWEFIIWDNSMILQLLEKYPKLLNLYKNPNKLSGGITKEATQSDIARYIILKEYGGLYYDLDFECVSSLNDLFEKATENKETVYIASSKIDFLDYIWPFFKPQFCSCFMGFQKNHPIWDKVISYIEKASDKYSIGQAIDKMLQESDYPILVFERIGGHYTCRNSNQICYTPRESSWNPIRPFMGFMNCYYKKIFLFFLVLVIIYAVEKINYYNIYSFGFQSFIPGISAVSASEKSKKEKHKKK